MHRPDVHLLPFEAVTRQFLMDYSTWMESNGCPSANARAIHLRNIRAAFNDAIANDVTQFYPFRKLPIVYEETRHRALTISEMMEIQSMQFDGCLAKYRDIFLLCFFLMGINMVDLFSAKWSDVIDGRLEYRRRKTGTLYSILLVPEALEIIERYKGKEHLLSMADKYKDYRDFVKKVNAALKRIRPDLSVYWARHTFASIAYEIGIPLDVISDCLGHKHGSPVTGIYVKKNLSQVDEAQMKVIGSIKNYTPK